MTSVYPLAKWQILAGEYIGEDVSRMHYQSAKEALDEKGVALVFGNTVKVSSGKLLYVAIIEIDHDWVCFVTEAAAAWRKVERFTLIMKGKHRITEILAFGVRWSGERITQREAKELAELAIFAHTEGVAFS